MTAMGSMVASQALFLVLVLCFQQTEGASLLTCVSVLVTSAQGIRVYFPNIAIWSSNLISGNSFSFAAESLQHIGPNLSYTGYNTHQNTCHDQVEDATSPNVHGHHPSLVFLTRTGMSSAESSGWCLPHLAFLLPRSAKQRLAKLSSPRSSLVIRRVRARPPAQ